MPGIVSSLRLGRCTTPFGASVRKLFFFYSDDYSLGQMKQPGLLWGSERVRTAMKRYVPGTYDTRAAC